MFYNNLNNPNQQRIASLYNDNSTLSKSDEEYLLSKAIEGINGLTKAEELGILSGMDDNDLEKGRIAMPIGAHANWGGVDYLKTASGWKPAGKFRGHVKENHDHIHKNEVKDKDHHEMTMDAGKMDEKEWTEKHGANLHSKYKAVHDYLHKPKAEKKEVKTESVEDKKENKEATNLFKDIAVKDESRYFGTKVIVAKNEDRFEDEFSGKIVRVLNGGNLIEVDKGNGNIRRVDTHLVTIKKLVDNGTTEKKVEQVEKKEETLDKKKSIFSDKELKWYADKHAEAAKEEGKNFPEKESKSKKKAQKEAPVETKEAHKERGLDESKGDVDVTPKKSISDLSNEEVQAASKLINSGKDHPDFTDKEIVQAMKDRYASIEEDAAKDVDSDGIPKRVIEQFSKKDKDSNYSFLNSIGGMWRRDNSTGKIINVGEPPAIQLPKEDKNGITNVTGTKGEKIPKVEDPAQAKIKAIADKAYVQYNNAPHVDKAKLKKRMEDAITMHENGLKNNGKGLDKTMVEAAREFLKKVAQPDLPF